jgi:hypothetical protein
MKRRNRTAILAGLVIGMGLTWAGAASAGPIVNPMQPCDCPPTHYSAMHVLTPFAWRWAAWCQGPRVYTFAPIHHHDVAANAIVVRYRCPSVDPLQYSLKNYVGLNGSPPTSIYQSPSQTKSETTLPTLPRPEVGSPVEKLPPPTEKPEKK